MAVDSLSYALVLPVLPFAVRDMGGGAVTVAVIFAAFSVCQLAAAPLLGRASDRWGRRPVLLLSQLGTLIGFMLLIFAKSPLEVLVSRIVDGASAGNLAVVYAAVCDRYPAQRRAPRFAIMNTYAGVGILCGLGLCAILTGRGFGLLAAVGAAAALVTIGAGVVVQFGPRAVTPERLDWRAIVLRAPAALRRSATISLLLQVLLGAFAVALPTLLNATLGAPVRTGIVVAGLAMLAGVAIQATGGVWVARRAGNRAVIASALCVIEAGVALLWSANGHGTQVIGLIASGAGAALMVGGLLSGLAAATSWLSGSAGYGAGLLMGVSQTLASAGQLVGPAAGFLALAAGPVPFLALLVGLGAAALVACRPLPVAVADPAGTPEREPRR